MTTRTLRRALQGAVFIASLSAGAAGVAAPDGSSADARDALYEAAESSPAAGHDHATARGVRKPTAPISIDHEWLEPAAVGRDLRLRIEVGSTRRLADVTISLNGLENLVVDMASRTTRVPVIEAGAPYTFEPAVFAPVGGTHYLAVSVTAVIGGAEQTRSVTIAVRLGGAVSSDEPSTVSDDAKATERVRSLPAEERVGRQ